MSDRMARIERITPAPEAAAHFARGLAAFFTDKLGPAIVGNAQRIVPVRTGHLHDSIVAQVSAEDPQDVLLEVGVDEDLLGVDYGLYVEKGTSRMKAEPYLVPATLQAGGTVAHP